VISRATTRRPRKSIKGTAFDSFFTAATLPVLNISSTRGDAVACVASAELCLLTPALTPLCSAPCSVVRCPAFCDNKSTSCSFSKQPFMSSPRRLHSDFKSRTDFFPQMSAEILAASASRDFGRPSCAVCFNNWMTMSSLWKQPDRSTFSCLARSRNFRADQEFNVSTLGTCVGSVGSGTAVDDVLWPLCSLKHESSSQICQQNSQYHCEA